jgi:ribosomal protein S18 acetylase RimI-like enzyme
MIVRRCNFSNRAELEVVHSLQRAAYEVEAALIGTREIPGLRETVEQLASSCETFWGCFGVAGVCEGVIATEPELENGVELVRISRLAVRPDCFRRGVGRRLVSHVLEQAPGRVVKVTTGAANAPGRRLYESLGFAFIGERVVGRGVRIVEYRRQNPRSPE